MGKSLNLENIISYDELYNLYITENKTAKQISLIYSCGKTSIFRLLKKYNIYKPTDLRAESSQNMIFEKYGVVNVFQSEIIKEKLKQTNLEKYGVESATQNNEIKNKIKNTMLKKYGFEYPKQTNKIIQTYFQDENTAREYIITNFKDMKATEIAKKIDISYVQLLRYLRRYNLHEYIDFKPSSSQYEDIIIEYLKTLGITNIEQHNKTILKNKEIDIYLPDYKLGIEINGNYWHSDIFKDKKYHLNKSLEAQEQGIHLVHLYEYELTDPIQLNKIKSILTIFTGNVTNKIYARKCTIKEITNKEAKPFNDMNHIQNHRNAQITYGLYYEDKLVQLMSFSKHSKYEWEIIRGCPGSNNVVIGGVSKLFNHFIKEKNPNTVFSYCDFNKFDGHGYEALGMDFIGYTGPDKSWLFDNKRKARSSKNYKLYSETCDGIIWGAGSKKYLWTNKKNKEN